MQAAFFFFLFSKINMSAYTFTLEFSRRVRTPNIQADVRLLTIYKLYKVNRKYFTLVNCCNFCRTREIRSPPPLENGLDGSQSSSWCSFEAEYLNTPAGVI